MPQNSNGSKRSFISGFLLHLHPRTVPAETVRLSLSLGLGGLAAMLLVVLFGTGFLQLLMYSPKISTAYDSVVRMYTDIAIGGWIRNIHCWAGNLLVIVTGLHLMRVFLTGAIGRERRMNWYIGLLLLFFVISANFSGYLLPWDQLSFWAATIFTSMFAYIPVVGDWLLELFRGGEEIGAETMSIFFALHVGFLPLLFGVFSLYHFWLVRRAGGLICRDNDSANNLRERVATVPILVEREVCWGLGFLAALLIFAALVDAPLGEPANPGLSPNPAKGGWYLVGLQELLLHIHPTFAIWILPSVVLLMLLLVPVCQTTVLPGGIWCGGREGRRAAVLALVLGIVLTVVMIVADDMLLRSDQLRPENDFWNRGIFLLIGYLVLVAGFAAAATKYLKLTGAKSVMLIFMLHVGMLLGLTVIGIWFRGAGMRLVWPL